MRKTKRRDGRYSRNGGLSSPPEPYDGSTGRGRPSSPTPWADATKTPRSSTSLDNGERPWWPAERTELLIREGPSGGLPPPPPLPFEMEAEDEASGELAPVKLPYDDFLEPRPPPGPPGLRPLSSAIVERGLEVDRGTAYFGSFVPPPAFEASESDSTLVPLERLDDGARRPYGPRSTYGKAGMPGCWSSCDSGGESERVEGSRWCVAWFGAGWFQKARKRALESTEEGRARQACVDGGHGKGG